MKSATRVVVILPHPEVAGMYAGRAAETDRWLRGMMSPVPAS